MVALFVLSHTLGARALPSFLSQSISNPTEVQTVADSGREVSIQVDFDGDHRPDLLTGSFVDGVYRIEIRLSSNSSLDTFRSLVSEKPYGIVVSALDVDGDNDLDLVVTDGFSLFPKAVWLGDGKGHFENGDPISWLGSFAIGRAATYRASEYGSVPAASGPTERVPFDRSPGASSHVISPAGEDVEYRKSTADRQHPLRQFSVRGPPFNCQSCLPPS